MTNIYTTSKTVIGFASFSALYALFFLYVWTQNEYDDPGFSGSENRYHIETDAGFTFDNSWNRSVLADGVALYRQHFDDLYNAPQYVSILSVDPSAATARIAISASSLYGESEMPVSGHAAQSGAIAAVNAGFNHGGPDFMNSGILIINRRHLPYFDDEPDSLSFVGSSALGIDSQGFVIFRERDGDNWDGWDGVDHAVAGGHPLIINRRIHRSIANQNSASNIESRHAGNRHPRTAVCTTPGNQVKFITVDGRHEESAGLTLHELANYMLSIGCKDGINLDGGGSTTMWTRDHGIVNHPSDNQLFDHEGERNSKTAIVIIE